MTVTETALAARAEPTDDVIEQVMVQGNLAALSPAQRASYYGRVCRSLGLNPLTRPFEYLTLQGKLIFYARKDATDQLRTLRRVSLTITAREPLGDLYVVTARATLPDGRTDEEIGAVPIAGLRGEALANAMMKASTKAKRRVTLSVCGLGWLDESEVDSIPNVRVGEPEEADPGPDRPRMAALAAEIDDALASDAPAPEPVEDPERQAKMATALDLHQQCLARNIRAAPPHAAATTLALDDYIARHRRVLANAPVRAS